MNLKLEYRLYKQLLSVGIATEDIRIVQKCAPDLVFYDARSWHGGLLQNTLTQGQPHAKLSINPLCLFYFPRTDCQARLVAFGFESPILPNVFPWRCTECGFCNRTLIPPRSSTQNPDETTYRTADKHGVFQKPWQVELNGIHVRSCDARFSWARTLYC